MSSMKRINFNAPTELWEKFTEILPYRGEPTAFFNRCMEAAVSTQVTEEAMRKIDSIIDKAREDALNA